jgi:hypothetical protein
MGDFLFSYFCLETLSLWLFLVFVSLSPWVSPPASQNQTKALFISDLIYNRMKISFDLIEEDIELNQNDFEIYSILIKNSFELGFFINISCSLFTLNLFEKSN